MHMRCPTVEWLYPQEKDQALRIRFPDGYGASYDESASIRVMMTWSEILLSIVIVPLRFRSLARLKTFNIRLAICPSNQGDTFHVIKWYDTST